MKKIVLFLWMAIFVFTSRVGTSEEHQALWACVSALAMSSGPPGSPPLVVPRAKYGEYSRETHEAWGRLKRWLSPQSETVEDFLRLAKREGMERVDAIQVYEALRNAEDRLFCVALHVLGITPEEGVELAGILTASADQVFFIQLLDQKYSAIQSLRLVLQLPSDWERTEWFHWAPVSSSIESALERVQGQPPPVLRIRDDLEH